MRVVKSEKWLNKTDNIAIDPKCCSNPGEKNGMYGKTHSQEVKDFISKNNKGREITKERRKQLSEQTTGAGNPNYGKHRPHTEEEKDIIRLASKKMWESEEHRKNMSIKHQGQSNGFYGKTHSEESLEKMRKSHRRNWALKRGLNEIQ